MYTGLKITCILLKQWAAEDFLSYVLPDTTLTAFAHDLEKRVTTHLSYFKFIIQNHLSFKTSSYKQLIALLHKPRNKQNLILAKMRWVVLTSHKLFQEGSPIHQCLLHCAGKWDSHLRSWALYQWVVSQFAGVTLCARTCWFCIYVIACPCMSETTEFRVIIF